MNVYNYEPIGMRIQKARQEKQMTQEELAAICDVNPKHIGRIETGKSGLSVSLLISICRALQISTDYILFGTVHFGGNTPLEQLINRFSDDQKAYAEELLQVYLKGCNA